MNDESKVAKRYARKEAKSTLDKDVGFRVRRLRKTMGLSVDRLSEALGITPSHVRLIEYGQRGVTLTLCQKLCEIFNLTADYIIYGDDYEENAANEKDSEELISLATKTLSKEEVQYFAEIIKEYSISRRTPGDAKLLQEALRMQLRNFFALKASVKNSAD